MKLWHLCIDDIHIQSEVWPELLILFYTHNLFNRTIVFLYIYFCISLFHFRHKINLGDEIKYPRLGRKMKAYKETIADEGTIYNNWIFKFAGLRRPKESTARLKRDHQLWPERDFREWPSFSISESILHTVILYIDKITLQNLLLVTIHGSFLALH